MSGLWHDSSYSEKSAIELDMLKDRLACMEAEYAEDRAEADAKRERADDHAEAVCPASRARWRACADERRAASELYPRGDVAATPLTPKTTTARPARRAA